MKKSRGRVKAEVVTKVLKDQLKVFTDKFQ
jgi:hypothetical protein